MRARFLKKSDARDIVNDIGVYERWVKFWTKQTDSDEIVPTRGRPVSVKDEKCIDALISTQKGNYILVDSGELLRKVLKSELDDVAEYLYNDLVSPIDVQPTKRDKTFATQCKHVLKEAGIKYKFREPIECTWKGVKRHLHPDYYIGNGTPQGILQGASMKNEHSVNSAALTMHTLLDLGLVQEKQCRFLMRMQDMTNEIADEGLKLLEQMCEVVDVDSVDATEKLSEFAGLPDGQSHLTPSPTPESPPAKSPARR